MKHMLKRIFSVIMAHPARNILLILTTTIGTAALGLSLQTTARIDRLLEETTGNAERRIVIANAKIAVDGSLTWTRPVQFTATLAPTLSENIQGVQSISVINQLPMDQIMVNNTYWKPSSVLGTDESYASVAGLKMIAGSFYSSENILKKDRVLVLSERAALLLFGSAEQAVGSIISIDNGIRSMGDGLAGGRGSASRQQLSPWSNFTVIGVYEDVSRFEAENYGIADYLLPYASMIPSTLSFTAPVRMFVARVSATSVKNIEAAIRMELDGEAGEQVSLSVWEGSPSSPGVSTIEKARQSLTDLSLVTSGLGLLILIIASFGIVSGLLVDAADRAKEIALKRSIGMTVVRGTFELTERSMALAGVGGLLGLLCTTGLSQPMLTILLPYFDSLGIGSNDISSHIFEIRTLAAPFSALFLSFVFSLLPAARSASSSIVDGLKD